MDLDRVRSYHTDERKIEQGLIMNILLDERKNDWDMNHPRDCNIVRNQHLGLDHVKSHPLEKHLAEMKVLEATVREARKEGIYAKNRDGSQRTSTLPERCPHLMRSDDAMPYDINGQIASGMMTVERIIDHPVHKQATQHDNLHLGDLGKMNNLALRLVDILLHRLTTSTL